MINLLKGEKVGDPKMVIIYSLFCALIISSFLVAGIIKWKGEWFGIIDYEAIMADKQEELAEAKRNLFVAREHQVEVHRRQNAQSELDVCLSGVKTFRKKEIGLRVRYETVKHELELLREESATYMDRYRQSMWSDVIGQTWDSIELTGGEVYNNIVVREMSDGCIRVKEGYAYRTLEVEELPRSIVKKYALEETEVERLADRLARLDLEIPSHRIPK